MNKKQMVNVVIVLICMSLLLMLISGVNAFAYSPEYIDVTSRITEQKEKQDLAHQWADCARALGHTDDDPIIKAAGQHWMDAEETISALEKLSSYTVRERDILASVIMQEAPYCTKEHKTYVAQVVLNRVADSRFPDSIERVVFAPGQYPGIHIRSDISAEAYEAAELAMMGLDDMPSDIVYQANFKQGKEVWKAIAVDTGYFKSTTYFCR